MDAGRSAGKSTSLTLDKSKSLESKILGASSEKTSCFQEIVSLLNQCKYIGQENQGLLETDRELKILGKYFKKQRKENKSLILKLCQKKKIKRLNTRNINKNLNRKELRYELAENL